MYGLRKIVKFIMGYNLGEKLAQNLALSQIPGNASSPVAVNPPQHHALPVHQLRYHLLQRAVNLRNHPRVHSQGAEPGVDRMMDLCGLLPT